MKRLKRRMERLRAHHAKPTGSGRKAHGSEASPDGKLGAGQAQKPSPPKKKRVPKRFSSQKAPEQYSDDDGELGAGQAQKPSPPKKKKRGGKGSKEKAMVIETRMSVKRPWSDAERQAVNKHLARFVAEKRVPGKADCLKCLEEKSLKERSWKDVKNFVHNTTITAKRRSASRIF